MNCLYCRTYNLEGALYCRACGNRLDGWKKCPNCGQLAFWNSSYCNACGSYLDWKRMCSYCKTVYEGANCPRCGLPSTMYGIPLQMDAPQYVPAVEVQEDPPQPEQPAEQVEPAPPIEEAPAVQDVVTESTVTEYAEESTQNSFVQKNPLSLLAGALAIFGILLAIVFACLIKFTGKSADINTDISYTVWYFFGEGYKDASASLDAMSGSNVYARLSVLLPVIFGTIVSVVMFICMAVSAIIAIARYASYISGKPTKSYTGAAIFSMLSFVAGACAILSLFHMEMSLKGSSGQGLDNSEMISAKFSTLTLVGIILVAVICVAFALVRLIERVNLRRPNALLCVLSLLSVATIATGLAFAVLSPCALEAISELGGISLTITSKLSLSYLYTMLSAASTAEGIGFAFFVGVFAQLIQLILIIDLCAAMAGSFSAFSGERGRAALQSAIRVMTEALIYLIAVLIFRGQFLKIMDYGDDISMQCLAPILVLVFASINLILTIILYISGKKKQTTAI